MPVVRDHVKSVVVVKTPAGLFVPKGMNPAETRAFSQNTLLSYLNNPSDQR